MANIGIAGNALKWFTSYISDRTSSILINGHISSPRNISYGVPQGFVLGPILFNIYLLPIFDIISKFPLISVHSYADDIQLNVKCTSDINFAPNLMSNCIKSIHTWLSNNSLSLNHNKTETIFLHLPSPRRPLTVPPFIMVNNHNILYYDNVKYLGVYFDSSLSFHRHISNLLRSINCHLHSFRLIRNSISLRISITLASSFILPLFDYCNILLFSLPGYQIKNYKYYRMR